MTSARRLLPLGLALPVLTAVTWPPLVARLERRSDARARAHVQALVDEGLPVEPAALEEPLARDGAQELLALVLRLGVTDAEREAARREEDWRLEPGRWRDPNGPPPPPLADDELPDEGAPEWKEPERYEAALHTAVVRGLLGARRGADGPGRAPRERRGPRDAPAPRRA